MAALFVRGLVENQMLQLGVGGDTGHFIDDQVFYISTDTEEIVHEFFFGDMTDNG